MMNRRATFGSALIGFLLAVIALLGIAGCVAGAGADDDENAAELGSVSSSLRTVVAPTFDPPSGTYPEKIRVKLATTTNNATIHYTLDGSEPTTSSPVYDGKIKVNITTTIKAFAVKPNFNPSPIVSASYEIGTQRVAPVVFTPPSGAYNNPVIVALSTSTNKATIHYTLDGSNPTTASPIYSAGAPINVSSNTTIKAFAVRKKWISSDVTQSTYNIVAPPAHVAPVNFNPPSGEYNNPLNVVLSTQTPNATIYYSTDGSSPTPATGTVYVGLPIFVDSFTTIRAIATAPGMLPSDETLSVYAFRTAPVIFNPPSGTYAGPLSVILVTMTPGATLYYTTDGSVPTPLTGTPYGGPFSITTSSVVTAMASKPGFNDSLITQSTYVIQP